MLHIALKEWAVVCDLLFEGKLTILLRKGGIAEKGGAGRFELEHQRFVLLPSWVHQKPARIKQPHCDRVVVRDSEPAELALHGFGVVGPGCIWEVPSRAAFDQLEDLHCWSKEQIDMRFDYKPDLPLYLMAVRAYRLGSPKTVVMRLDYAGCKSWVTLHDDDAIDDAVAAPVMDDASFATIVSRIKAALG